MAVTIVSKAKTVEVEQVVETTLEDEADVVYDLRQEVAKAKAAMEKKAAKEITALKAAEKALSDKLKELGEAVQEFYGEEDEDEKFTVEGSRGVLVVSAKGRAREIHDMALLKELFEEQDPDLFVKLAQVKLGDVDKYLSPEEQALVIKVVRGKRSLTPKDL